MNDNDNLDKRLFVEQSIGKGSHITLNKDQSHYLRNVLRCKEHQKLTIFNPTDGQWEANIEEVNKNKVIISPNLLLNKAPDDEPDIWLIFAPIKHGRIDYLVQKATEIGATKLIPIKTERTIAARVNIKRLKKNCIEAAEQCGRITVPEINDLMPLKNILSDKWDNKRQIFWCDETGKGISIYEKCRDMPKMKKYAVLIGPEGGFSPSEVEYLSHLPYIQPVSLGPRILRSDTAAITALSCCYAALGDWDKKRPNFV